MKPMTIACLTIGILFAIVAAYFKIESLSIKGGVLFFSMILPLIAGNILGRKYDD